VVGVLAQQMRLVLNRQKRRSPRYSQIADLAARRDGGAIAAKCVLRQWLAWRIILPFLLFLE